MIQLNDGCTSLCNSSWLCRCPWCTLYAMSCLLRSTAQTSFWAPVAPWAFAAVRTVWILACTSCGTLIFMFSCSPSVGITATPDPAVLLASGKLASSAKAASAPGAGAPGGAAPGAAPISCSGSNGRCNGRGGSSSFTITGAPTSAMSGDQTSNKCLRRRKLQDLSHLSDINASISYTVLTGWIKTAAWSKHHSWIALTECHTWRGRMILVRKHKWNKKDLNTTAAILLEIYCHECSKPSQVKDRCQCSLEILNVAKWFMYIDYIKSSSSL